MLAVKMAAPRCQATSRKTPDFSIKIALYSRKFLQKRAIEFTFSENQLFSARKWNIYTFFGKTDGANAATIFHPPFHNKL